MKKILIIVISLIIIFGVGIFIGRVILGGNSSGQLRTQISSQSILEKLQEEGFLVTQSSIINQKVIIDRSTGVAWKDFFWGQTLEAYAAVKVNSGVDLSKLEKKDVDVKNGEITIILPIIEHKSVELVGEIFLDNDQGVLKRVFDNDDGYNKALVLLKEEALKSRQTQEAVEQIKSSSVREIIRLFRLIDSDLVVVVEFNE